MTTIEAPRTPARRSSGTNWEKWGWLYMRASGVVLLVLIFGHLFVNLVAGQGIKQVDFGFVAGKWAAPFWQWWDCAMLWLALIHGANGMRTLTNDYARGRLRKVLLGAILVSTIVLILLGSLVIFTFDPCIGAAQGGDLAQFCAAKG